MSVRILKAMKILYRIFLTVIAAVTALFLLTGCGSKEKTRFAHYEKVLETLTLSVRVLDTQSYLKCFSEGARAEYVASDRYDPNLCEKLADSDGKKRLALIAMTLEHNELDSDAIAKLKDEYNQKYARRINITKAYELKTEFTSGDKINVKTLVVYNDGNEWRIFGDVIENFFQERQGDSNVDNL